MITLDRAYIKNGRNIKVILTDYTSFTLWGDYRYFLTIVFGYKDNRMHSYSKFFIFDNSVDALEMYEQLIDKYKDYEIIEQAMRVSG